jgi:hypothetical protein
MHLIFRCPIYYEIRGRYHCLYRDSGGSLSTFFRYQDQRCLALFIREIFCHRSQFLHATPRLGMTRTITSYFHADPSDRSNKRRVESQSTLDSRLVRPRVSPQPLPQGDRSSSSRPIRKCHIHISPHILRELEGLAPDSSRAGHLPSIGPPPSFRRATRVLFGVSFFRPRMLGVSLAPTSPQDHTSQTSDSP